MNVIARIFRLPLYWQILIAILLAAMAGSVTTEGSNVFQIYAFFGKLFLNALQMVVVPLIFASIISAVMGIGGGDFGRIGLKTGIFYIATGLLSVTTGMIVVNLIGPGYINGQAAGNFINFGLDQGVVDSALSKVSGRDSSDLFEIFLRLVPPNIVAAAAQMQLLGLIFFSMLFGYYITKLDDKKQLTMRLFWEGTLEVMLSITHWVMKFAPYGVFALIAKIVAATGFATFASVFSFFVSVVLALSIHIFVVMPLILMFVARINPVKHYRAMAPALLTAFSTASSVSTLPITIDCIRTRAGVSQRTAGFVLPLGATINMDGTALYECAAVLFIAQVYGLELGFFSQLLIVLTALLTSVGVAGIPAASLVAITVILTALGLPLEGIGLLLITDRVLDMMRTATNVFGDSCSAVVIARSEGERLNL